MEKVERGEIKRLNTSTMTGLDYQNLEWRCGICKNMRKSENVSTLAYNLVDVPRAVRHIVYCNDSLECEEKALIKKRTGKV